MSDRGGVRRRGGSGSDGRRRAPHRSRRGGDGGGAGFEVEALRTAVRAAVAAVTPQRRIDALFREQVPAVRAGGCNASFHRCSGR